MRPPQEKDARDGENDDDRSGDEKPCSCRPAAREPATPLATVDGRDASERANAMSLADWNRLSRSFSRQCLTMWSSAGEMFRPDSESSGGSSRRIAAIVSAAVSRLNALFPDSIS